MSDNVKHKRCAICKKEYIGYGNNPDPVCEGKCCDECNARVVIPARFKILLKK